MKRLNALVVVSAVLIVVTGCGGADSASSGDLPDVSTPTVTEPAAEPATEPVTPDPTTAELAGDTVVFVWTENGGCFQGGPNCARYEVTVDGSVETFRVGDAEAGGPEVTGSVDATLVQAWRDSLAGEDIDVLRSRVGEGELTAAFDGVDFELVNPVTGVELSSVETAFDPSEPVFATAAALAEAARTAAPLDMQMR